jgi:hypothetical protein
MGDFQPLAHVNGSLGCSLMALTANSFSANALFISIVVDDFIGFMGIIVRGWALWGG